MVHGQKPMEQNPPLEFSTQNRSSFSCLPIKTLAKGSAGVGSLKHNIEAGDTI